MGKSAIINDPSNVRPDKTSLLPVALWPLHFFFFLQICLFAILVLFGMLNNDMYSFQEINLNFKAN